MEKTLNEILSQNQKRKSKSEIVTLLKGINNLIGNNAYSDVSGVQVSELEDLTKADLVAIVDQFSKAYDEGWETKLGQVGSNTMNMIFQSMAADDLAFSSSAAADADFAAELGSIDFANLIGGPLNACVTAQSNASVSTVSFIKEVGFSKPTNPTDQPELIMVDFTHNKSEPNPDFDNTKPAGPSNLAQISKKVDLKVPFIALLNIPSLRIETCDIDFNVKLNSTYTKKVDSSIGVNASASGGFWGVKFKVSASYKRSSSTGIKVEKQYTMGVKVKATNDEMPAGLEKVLGIIAA